MFLETLAVVLSGFKGISAKKAAAQSREPIQIKIN